MKLNGFHVVLGAVAVLVVTMLIVGNSGIISTKTLSVMTLPSYTQGKQPGTPTMKFDKTSYVPGDKVRVYISAETNKLGTNQISYFMLMISVNDKSLGGNTINKVKAVFVMGSTNYKGPNQFYDNGEGNQFIYNIPKISALPSKMLIITFQAYSVDNAGRQSQISTKTLQMDIPVFKVK